MNKEYQLASVQKFIAENQNNIFEYPEPPPGNVWEQSEWIFRNSHAPYLEMDLYAPFEEMLAEARAARHRFVRHREGDGYGWLSLCIHGISAEQTDAANMYGYDHGEAPYRWTDIADLCPVTANYFKAQFPFQFYHRLRFMLLEPGGFIIPHSDNMTSNLGAATNISLNNPRGCRMVTERGVVPFKNSGSIMMFNNHYQHVVYNDSNEDRYHIIVHGAWDGKLWNPIIQRSYEQARNSQNSR
jgi:hypothetical protein